MTIRVHHLSDSRSQRILWMLEELGLDYDVVRYERDPKTMLAPSALRAIHPLGKAPIVEDDDRVLVETGAIIDHFVRREDNRLGPPPGADFYRWHQYLHYAEGSLMPPLFGLLVARRLGPLGWPARKPLTRMFEVHLRWLEAELGSRDWFAGDSFTAADIMMSFPLEAARDRAGLDDRFPCLQAWLNRIHTRPAYKAALAKGGAYSYA